MGPRTRHKISDLTSRPVPELRGVLRELVRGMRTVPNGELPELDAKIRKFESRSGFNSQTLLARVKSGEQRETWEVCEWLLLLDLRESIAALRSSSPR